MESFRIVHVLRRPWAYPIEHLGLESATKPGESHCEHRVSDVFSAPLHRNHCFGLSLTTQKTNPSLRGIFQIDSGAELMGCAQLFNPSALHNVIEPWLVARRQDLTRAKLVHPYIKNTCGL